MKFKAIHRITLFTIIFWGLPLFAQDDFLTATWGMSKSEVKELIESWPEESRGNILRDDDSLLVIEMYMNGPEMASPLCWVRVFFVNGKLTHGIIHYTLLSAYENQCIENYEKYKAEMIKNYGEPRKDIQSWQNTLYKSNKEKWEYAIKLRHVSFLTEWEIKRSIVVMVLTEFAGHVSLLTYNFSKDYFNSSKLKALSDPEEKRNLINENWNKAKVLHKQGKHLEAATLFHQTFQDEKFSPQPRHNFLGLILNNAGFCYYEAGQLQKAIECYSEALSIFRTLGQQEYIAMLLRNIAAVHQSWGQYEKAIELFEEALVINKTLGREDEICSNLNDLGYNYVYLNKYEKAIAQFEEALSIARKLNNEVNCAGILSNIGGVYEAWSEFDKAIKYYEEAIVIDKKFGKNYELATHLNNLAGLYMKWGQYDKTAQLYGETLSIIQKLEEENDFALVYNNIGMFYKHQGQYDKAIGYFEKAFACDNAIGKKDNITTYLMNIGSALFNYKRFDEAMNSFQLALSIAQNFGQEDKIAVALNNIATVYSSRGEKEKAVEFYNQALNIYKKLGTKVDVAFALRNIGDIYYTWRKELKAIEYLKESVELTEEIRKTATNETTRRDYLSKQMYEMNAYQLLISAYVRNGNLKDAFDVIELSHAKLLNEKFSNSESEKNQISLIDVQKELSESSAILIYANADRFNKVLLVITKDKLTGIEIPDSAFKALVFKSYGAAIDTMLKKTITLESWKSYIKFDDFENAINYYHSILINQKKPDANVTRLGRLIYDFLILPIKNQIADKKYLIIVPDGVLGFIPFETLIDENGHYLIENYYISYSQSMTILNKIKNRQYAAKRKSLLAFGGAVYNEVTYNIDMIQNENQLSYLMKKLYSLSTPTKDDIPSAYASLGIKHWNNLPGSLKEVEAIKKTVIDSEILTGRDVSEDTIKSLSAKGELAKYKALHFATHGLVVSDIPELSALVLSQYEGNQGKEDGYLCINEISRLNIKADFVNLSACNTGVGKLYGGEGIVGLTQSFLIAGANGISTSLWEVRDESTYLFMAAMYELVEKQGMDYANAITEIKRRFIKGEFGIDYKLPFYWAPFVYYGQSSQGATESRYLKITVLLIFIILILGTMSYMRLRRGQ